MNSLCTEPLFLRIIYISGKILNVLRFVVPIVLIIKISMDVYKHIINPDDKEGLGKVKNKIIAAIIIFLTPTLVKVVFGFVEKTLVNYEYSDLTICHEFANIKHIEALEADIAQDELDLYLPEKAKNLNARERYLESIKQYVASQSAATEIGKYVSNKNNIVCGTGAQYNTGLFNAVRTAGLKTREGVVAATLYLSSHINVRIPYFWSGGHGHTYTTDNASERYEDFGDNFIGVSNRWGCNYKMIGRGTDKQKPGSYYPFGMDCSGFVNWAIMNGGYYTGTGKQSAVPSTDNTPSTSLDGISVTPIEASLAKGKAKPGDIAFKSGHVAMIVEVSENGYKVAEEKGADYGLVVSKDYINFGDTFTHIILMDNFYANYKKNESPWVGFK